MIFKLFKFPLKIQANSQDKHINHEVICAQNNLVLMGS